MKQIYLLLLFILFNLIHSYGQVDGDSRFDAVITYVSVDPKSQRPSPIPDIVKEALSK